MNALPRLIVKNHRIALTQMNPNTFREDVIVSWILKNTWKKPTITNCLAEYKEHTNRKSFLSEYPGPGGQALLAPKGLLFNSHWHVAEHPEMGRIRSLNCLSEVSFQTPGRF
jgi:hypothetical protein